MKEKTENGKKVCSILIIFVMVLGMMILSIRMPNVEAYTMPAGVTWDMDDLVSGSGGAVSGPVGGPYIFHETVVIPATSTLNIGPGDECRFDGNFRIEVDGALNAIGTSINRILMTSNSLTPAPGDWDGVQFNSGSDPSSSIRYANLSYGNSIRCFSSSPSIINSEISSFSLWAIGGWNTASPTIDNNDIHTNGLGMEFWDTASPTIINNTIDNNMGPGIHFQFMGSPLISSIVNNNTISSNDGYGIWVEASAPIPPVIVDNNNITNNTYNGIRISSGSGTITSNNIYGKDAPLGSFERGGNGILVSGGIIDIVLISRNNITGGDGDEYNPASLTPPHGGRAISCESFQGIMDITDNFLIQGGNGGINLLNGGQAGRGGAAIFINPVSNPPNTIEISDNLMIKGGRGGDNYAMNDGNASQGGAGLNITDDDNNRDLLIRNNSNIIGGDGGDNYANWLNGWKTGGGGNAISLINCRSPGKTEISLNPNVRGGKGGNTIGVGFFMFPLPPAGNGGNGIHLFSSDNIIITRTTTTGGDGGNNSPTAFETAPGNGGHGILLDSFTIIGSSAAIESSTLTGGEGGDNWVQIFGEGWDGRGGNALYSILSTGGAIDSLLTGGKGGDNYGPGAMAGPGGSGFSGSGAFNIAIKTCDILGGKGGRNFHTDGFLGGSGGTAVSITDNCDGITISGGSNIVGGDGGDADVGWSPGNGAWETIVAWSSSNISIIGYNITTGIGGYNASSGEYGQNGTRCFYLWDLGGSNNIVGNDVTTKDRVASTDGIYCAWFDTMASLTIAENTIYENYHGIYLQDIDDVTIGDDNRIFDNYYGIRLSQINPYIGIGNIIQDSEFGIYCWISSPTVTETQILNSAQHGLYLSAGSDAIVQRTSVINSSISGVYCEGGSSPEFYNSTISSGPGADDFLITGDSHPWTLNTTFNKGATSYGDDTSNLTVNWFMHARVVDVDNAAVGGATLWVNDSYGTPHPGAPFTTPSDGWVRWIIVTEYVENLTGYEYRYTPHNASAKDGSRFGYTMANMSFTRNVIVVLDGISFQIPLKKGWNLISVPMNQSNTSIKKVLDYIDGKYLIVEKYNVSDLDDHWKHYAVNKVSTPFESFNDLQNITREMGFWIYMTQDDVLSLVGSVPIPTTTGIQLKAGWNHVGYPSITPRIAGVGLGEAFESITGSVDIVQYYNVSDSSDPWKEWDIGSYTPDDLTVVGPGYGLWILVTGDCIWNVDW